MAWAEPKYSKSAVRRAGELLGSGKGSVLTTFQAREIVSNFRSSHAYPLLAITMHVRRYALLVSSEAVVARRLKRLPTILDKLERQPRMNVTTMQDLGGCRVVLATVNQIDELVTGLEGSRRARNAIVRRYDYLRDSPGPQNTGYRGVHLVFEYRASKQPFVGHKVEVQIRTELQHSWATAVETLDLFGGTRLKYADADPDHSRYFLIVSALMAAQEHLPQPAGATASVRALREELTELEGRLGLMDRLRGYAALVEQFGGSTDRRSSLILELHRQEKDLFVSFFETLAEAEERLAAIELLDDENIDAVLVGMGKVDQLQSAYPNYFANTASFTGFVEGHLNT
ncbi:RelA/SpoT domain-containing protein [Clavibacter sp. VKM Ac-2542]|uniref:RelA/SpoT domain-containing protein n=1 Tax=Clavibacter sp. VKM Ac-2542 TaxID=2783811 RepID=UPI00188B6734|nr:RelA/SpoT domain-containing protein [Clavibacter sp. VKM Ac-2542]MBF4621121.1 RelA/SpoT domain-containing protein [Clavibacter sp. VKM Ac-2542]